MGTPVQINSSLRGTCPSTRYPGTRGHPLAKSAPGAPVEPGAVPARVEHVRAPDRAVLARIGALAMRPWIFDAFTVRLNNI